MNTTAVVLDEPAAGDPAAVGPRELRYMKEAIAEVRLSWLECSA